MSCGFFVFLFCYFFFTPFGVCAFWAIISLFFFQWKVVSVSKEELWKILQKWGIFLNTLLSKYSQKYSINIEDKNLGAIRNLKPVSNTGSLEINFSGFSRIKFYCLSCRWESILLQNRVNSQLHRVEITALVSKALP